MSAVEAVQKAIDARLSGAAAVTSLVPALHIRDGSGLPDRDPCIILGDNQVIDEGDSIARKIVRVYATLHVWKKESGSVGTMAIVAAIIKALKAERLALDNGFHCVDCHVSNGKFMRDPDGVTCHAVVSTEVVVAEIA